MSDETSPTSRALRTLELLQSHPGITAHRLADHLGVTERAARRYVAILREADIPVEAVRGPYGGYRLGRGLRLPPVTFDQTEALGLVMAVLDGHHAAGEDDSPVGRALGKILRALPAAVSEQASVLRRTAAPAPDRAAARPDPARTAALVQACADGRRVRIDYRTGAGTAWTSEVEPWAVVVRHSRWYLLGRLLPREADRALRIDRIGSVEVLGDPVVAPADLDPVAWLEAHLATGWEHETEVEIDAPVETARRWVSPALGRLEPIDAERSRLVGSTSNPGWYAEVLAGLPTSFRVVGSPALRAATRAVGERLLAAIADPDADRPEPDLP